MHRLLNMAARIVAIAGIGFISLFALDIFSVDASPPQIALGLLMHLLPSVVLAAVLALGWRWPLAGGTLYLIIATLPMLFLSNPPWVNAMLSAPFAVAGILFIAAALSRNAR